MDALTLTIRVSPDTGARLREKARSQGQDVVEYVEVMVAEQARQPTLDELLAPMRKQVEESGVTEDEIDEFMYALRKQVNEEKRRQNQLSCQEPSQP